MQSAEHAGLIAIRLEPGEEVHATLLEICRQHAVVAGFFVSGIGMLENPELGFLTAPGTYDRHLFHGAYELLNLSGNVSLNAGEPMTHIHVTLSGPDHKAFGGHLFTAAAAITIEVLLVKLGAGVSLQREFEAASGLPGLQVRSFPPQ
jgi:predicted DNA-binding protein with PD1-like motif